MADVAPYEPCIVCFKGDTTTGLKLAGRPVFLATALHLLGIPPDEASALVHKQSLESDDAEQELIVRIYAQCAEEHSGWAVYPLNGDAIMIYTEPPSWRDRLDGTS